MIGVIINPRSGYVAHHGLDETVRLIRHAVPDVEVHVLQKSDDVGAIVRRFVVQGAHIVAAAGGDGTVSSVAAHLVNTPTPLGVIPVGTLNHFARDVGVGRNVVMALRTLVQGSPHAVDVARVNGRLFLNNSSLGVYPAMVELRERYEGTLGKWQALTYAAWVVLRSPRPVSVYLRELDADELPVADGIDEIVRTYLLFVGNNSYELDLLRLGMRTCLDAGMLGCFILSIPKRRGLLRHIYHYFFGHHPDRGMFREVQLRELVVRTPRDQIEVACDGEIMKMRGPLVYRIESRALTVIVPEPPPEESRAARDALPEGVAE